MNYHRLKSTFAVAALVAATATAGAAPIPVRATASLHADTVVLDIFADAKSTALRGFGIEVRFDPGELSPKSGGCYEGLWFLRGEDGVRHTFTDLTVPERGRVRVVGGRLDAADPGSGVAGEHVLLATLVLERLTKGTPKIELGLASPSPYVNFASASGDPLDGEVKLLEVEIQAAPEDRDGDGLPDDHELAVYGDLATSDGATDTDGDGDSDADEWLRGTDPNDPGSKFRLEIVPQPDGSKLVVWSGELGRVYDLEWSGDLGAFEPIAEGIAGNAALLEALDGLHNADPDGFYRVKTRFPTAGR